MPTARRPIGRLIPAVLYAHPLELALAASITLAGFRSLLLGDAAPPSLADAMGRRAFVVAWQFASIAGGLAVIAGIIGRRRPMFRAVDRAGSILIAGVDAAYAVALIATGNPGATYAALTFASIAGGALLRAVSIAHTERIVIDEAIRAAEVEAIRAAARARILEAERRTVGGDAGDARGAP